MASLTITVPDDVQSMLETHATEIGYPNLEGFVQSLLTAEARAITKDGAPDHLSIRSTSQLETLLLSRVDGPTAEMTADDWAAMKSEVIERAKRRQSAEPGL